MNRDIQHFSNAVEELRASNRRQAIRDYRNAMRDVRRFARDNREWLDADWEALPCPPRRIEEHVALLSERNRGEEG